MQCCKRSENVSPTPTRTACTVYKVAGLKDVCHPLACILCGTPLSAGVALSAMMFITTILTSLVYLMVYDANVFLVLAFFFIFGFMDMVYLSANLNKIPSGGWFAVAVAGGVFIVSAIWWWGTSKKGKYLREHKVRVFTADLEIVSVQDPGSMTIYKVPYLRAMNMLSAILLHLQTACLLGVPLTILEPGLSTIQH